MSHHRLPPLFAEWLRKEYAYVPDIEKFVSARYDVTEAAAERDSWYEVCHRFNIEGRGGRRASLIEWWDLTSREDPYHLARAAEGETIKVYDDVPVGWPQRDAIPFDRRLAYRGMSWEEWQNVLRTRHIGSAGWYNLGPSQEGRTYFGSDPGQAEHYASGFTPWMFKPAHGRPGVVVSVSKQHLRWEEKPSMRWHRSPARPVSGEMSHAGRLPIREILGVWFLVATKVRPGWYELWVDKVRPGAPRRPPRSGSASGPSVEYVVVPAHHARRKW